MNNQYEHMIRKYFFRFLDDRLTPLGVSGPLGYYLVEINKRSSIKMNQLVDLTPYHKSHSTRIVTKLHEMKLITKEIDPEDMRGYILSITDEGRKKAALVEKAHLDWVNLESQALTKEEITLQIKLSEKTYLFLKNYFDEGKK